MALDLDALKCQVCNLAEPEDNFLLCDGCAHGYHAPCLNQQIPETRFWFCPDCNGTTVKGCVIQVLEQGGLAGLTAAELNAGVLALRVSDLDAEEISPVLVAAHNNTTVGERSRLVHGVHGRLDDGRCLVERLPPDEYGVVRFRLAPEELISPQLSEGLAALSSQSHASQATLTETAQAPASVNNATAVAPAGAAGAEVLSLYEDIVSSQNLNPDELPAVQLEPSQGVDSAESPRGQPAAPHSTRLPQNVGFTRLAERSPGPSVHSSAAGHGLCLRLETTPAAVAPPVPLAGPLALPLAASLAAPRSPRPLSSRPNSETVSAMFEGASLGTTCKELPWHGQSAPAKQPQPHGVVDTLMGALDQPALVMRPADQTSGTQCLRLRSGGRRTESNGMQGEEVLPDGPAIMEQALHQQPVFVPSPPIQDTCEPDTVLLNSEEESPDLKQMEVDSASDEEGRNADCVSDHMLLDPIYHMGVHGSSDSCARAAALDCSTARAYGQGACMQQQDKGSGSMHAMALPHSRDEAAHSAADALPNQAAAAHLPTRSLAKSYQARSGTAQALLPQTPEAIPVKHNKRKREEGTAEQGAPSSKQRCQAAGWSSFCSDIVMSIYRVVLIVWLVRDMLYDKP